MHVQLSKSLHNYAMYITNNKCIVK